ncbi:MAG: DUF484 family protein [Sphingomonas bacterium]|nr:DUF484 family protein [Sphingomonas bacterium]
MGRVISFEERAVARLRDRLGEAETARADLLAFARGHSGAVASIHGAMLSALEADSLDDLLTVVTYDWPAILGLDSVVLALVVGDQAFRADRIGIDVIARPIVNRAMQSIGAVELRNVERGHPLFGEGAAAIRSEALIRIESPAPLPYGLLALGQHGEQTFETPHGADLLLFLGQGLSAMIKRWAMTEPASS